MQTELDCIPCFFSQALRAVRKVCPDEGGVHARALARLGAMLPEFDMTQPPPALAGDMYAMLRQLTGVEDFFVQEKKQANERVLQLLPGLAQTVRTSADPLETALEISIIGNYMDCGVGTIFDWESELDRLGGALDVDTMREFHERLEPGTEVLIVGDNAGEIGLDRLFVQELLGVGVRVTYAVRGAPILNDATMEDARCVGMDQLCEVISSGVDTPGAVVSRCTPEFQDRLTRADVLLAKGQGNYEALTDSGLNVYFAFKVKCPVVAGRAGLPEKTSAFFRHS
ncbi:MAG: ARMT1-like domain-containing protein [Desulfovibrio sp.]|jgi:hypothetical protein|nr:ARMT1-like domain-containing protein [Desulfovibrio sp.]